MENEYSVISADQYNNIFSKVQKRVGENSNR